MGYAGGILQTNFDYSKIFIWDNRYTTATYTDSGSGSTLVAGTIMGRVTASGKVKPCLSNATDGSQIPRFVLANNYTVTAAASQTVTLCFYGGVAGPTLTFSSSPADSVTTQVYLNDGTTPIGAFGDVLAANGIFIEGGVDNTYYNNLNA